MDTARCGRTDEHGAHLVTREDRTIAGWCAGNRDIIREVTSPFVIRALEGKLPAKELAR